MVQNLASLMLLVMKDDFVILQPLKLGILQKHLYDGIPNMNLVPLVRKFSTF